MRLRDTAATLANLLVIGLVAFTLLRPTGPIGASVVRQYRGIVRKKLVARDWKTISAARRLDSSSSSVALVEFADYECPACRRQYASLERILNDPQVGGLAYRHRPLPIHARAQGAARAAICADKQGRFREMHHQLFTTATWISDTNWVREAISAGVRDTSAFRACQVGAESAEELRADVALADSLMIDATPTFVGRTDVYVGMMPDTSYLRRARLSPR